MVTAEDVTIVSTNSNESNFGPIQCADSEFEKLLDLALIHTIRGQCLFRQIILAFLNLAQVSCLSNSILTKATKPMSSTANEPLCSAKLTWVNGHLS